MTRAKISQYSATANDNTDVNGVNIAEGCPPSSMNNMGREIMAALKRFQVGSDGDGVTVGGSLVVSGSTSVNTFNVDVISEKTSAAGVTVDGVLLKDSGVVTGAGTVSAPVYSTTGDTNTGIFFPAADTIAFAEGGAEAMRINSSGNVGIGVSTVLYDNRLHLSRTVSGQVASVLALQNTDTGTGSGSSLVFLQGANGQAEIFSESTSGANDAALIFKVRGNASLPERMRIDSSGNVGIGTSSPNTKLTVSGGAVRAGGFVLDDRGTGATVSWPDWRLFNNTSNQFEINNFSSTAILCGASSEVYFPAIGTTASAANAHLVSGDSNKLLRSTSSIRYKTDVETLDPAKSKAILNFRPVWYRSLAEADRKDWSWYGLIAEEVAEIEPRLVHWSYPESEYEEVETEVEQERTVTDEDGNETTETYTETKTERKLKEDAQLAPDGVQYDRLTVMLLDIVKRQDESIKALEARIAALEQA